MSADNRELTDLQPVDETGSQTLSRFTYQVQYATRQCILMLIRGDPLVVVCESHDDVVCLQTDGTARLISVKHREPRRGPWSLRDLLDPVARLYLGSQRLTGLVKAILATNASLGSRHSRASAFAKACESGEVETFVGQLQVAVGKLAQADETATHPGRIADFLRCLRFETELPNRTHLAHHDINAFMVPALKELGCEVGLAQESYTALEVEVRARTQGGEGVATSLLHLHHGVGPSEATEAIVRWAQAHSLNQQQVRAIVDRVFATATVPRDPQLPPRPLCIDRERERTHLTACITQRRPGVGVCVLGGPGLGKSTVTLEVCHSDPIVQVFGARRWFVRCDGARSVDSLIAAIGNSLGLPSQGNREDAVLLAFRAAPGLLLLDNAETPWWSDRAGTETLLAKLLEIPALAVVLSMRSRTPPRYGQWSLVEVPPLAQDDARVLFETQAGPEALGALQSVVDELEGHSTAVWLLSLQARGTSDYEGLSRRWTTDRTRLLRSSPVSPEGGEFGVAVEVTADSPLITPSARVLFMMLGQTPDGIAHSDLPALLGKRADSAAWSLGRAGLAFDEQARLRVLAPVREHLARFRPPTPQLYRRLINHYLALASDLGGRVGYLGGAEARTRLVQESGNLDAALEAGLARRDPRPAIDIVLSLTNLIRYVGVGGEKRLLDALERAGAVGDRLREARVLKSLGQVAQARWKLDLAQERFAAAREVFSAEGDIRGVADCVMGLVTIAQAYEDPAEALRLISEAEGLYRNANWPKGTADCLNRRAAIRLWSGDPRASEWLTEAFEGYRSADDLLGMANCLKNLGDIEMLVGHEPQGEARYLEAMPLYEEVGDILGEANCRLRLAQVALEQWEGTRHSGQRVKDLLMEAEERYRQIGSKQNLANCLKTRADNARLEGQMEPAKALYQQALAAYADIPTPLGQGQCLTRLADLALEEGEMETARQLLEQALPFAEQQPDLPTMASVHISLARLAQSEDTKREHVMSAREALRQVGNEALLSELEKEFGS